MEFRSFEQLNSTITNNLSRIPNDVDLIVGVPRSGMLVASIIALHLHLPLTDVKGLKEKRVMQSGQRMESDGDKSFSDYQHVLIIDDSVNEGTAILRVKSEVNSIDLNKKITYAAVFNSPSSPDVTDLVFDVCPLPRIFEWNMLNHTAIKNAAVELEGVLCEEDGRHDLGFSTSSAKPLLRSKKKIGIIISEKPERLRSKTEEWLKVHGYSYEQIIFTGNDSIGKDAKIDGLLQKVNGVNRPKFYIGKKYKFAKKLASRTGRMVYCMDENVMVYPRVIDSYSAKVRSKIIGMKQRLFGDRLSGVSV